MADGRGKRVGKEIKRGIWVERDGMRREIKDGKYKRCRQESDSENT